ncbi:hypothetical protein L208DRAFT_337193 [Tricholoma matsutake]|nr:hypothetical protein L208DRAFT_337193 [Tricholoma matsutake 945]
MPTHLRSERSESVQKCSSCNCRPLIVTLHQVHRNPNEKKENTSSTPKSSVKRKQEASPDTSSKRVKSAPAQPAYTKHPRFWALDGNILIQIGSTRFKLHRSRLTSQSPWFEKLFEWRQGQMLEMQTGGVEDHDDIADINDVRIEERRV